MNVFTSKISLPFNFPNIIIWTFYFAKHILPKKNLVFYNKKIKKFTK